MKAIIFDFDDVIVNSMTVHHQAEIETFRRFDIHVKRDDLHGYTGMKIQDKMADLIDKHDASTTVDDMMNHHYDEQLPSHIERITLVTGVKELLATLHEKFPIAVASGSPRVFVEDMLKKHALEPFFQSVVTADDITHSKPHPEIFLLAAKKLDVPAEACVVIEDAGNGVEAAHRAGMKCIGFDRKNGQDVSKADIVVNDLDEVEQVLSRF